MPSVSTSCSSIRIGPSKPVFQRTSGSPDQAYLDTPRYADADNRLVYGSLAFHLPKVISRGTVEAPANDSYAEEVQTRGKESRGRCTWRTSAPWHLGTTRYPPGHIPWPVLPINFAPVGARAQTTPRGRE